MSDVEGQIVQFKSLAEDSVVRKMGLLGLKEF
jgi:hypothetical protein